MKKKTIDKIIKKIEKKKTPTTTLDDVLNMVTKWSKDNNTCFHGMFMSFDKTGDIKEDRLIAFGCKECIEISLKDFIKMVKEDKEEFLDW